MLKMLRREEEILSTVERGCSSELTAEAEEPVRERGAGSWAWSAAVRVVVAVFCAAAGAKPMV